MTDKRCELKFTTSEANYHFILNWILNNAYNFRKNYPKRFVNSIYFDTYSYDSFAENILGSSKKTKIRYRWYGNLTNEIKNGSLEIKKRDNIFNYKNIYEIRNLTINKDKKFKDIIDIIKLNLPIEASIEFETRPFPTTVVRYIRDYFINFDNNIRITIDKNIKVYDQRLNNTINLNNKIILSDLMVIEFKFKDDLFENVNHILKDFPIKASKNSKYINAIRSISGI